MNYNALMAARAVAVTPSDTTRIVFSRLYVGGAGTVTIECEAGGTCQFTCPAGAYIDVRGVRVLATGTAATLIVALSNV